MPQESAQQRSEFGRRKVFAPATTYTGRILFASIIVSIVAGAMTFFIKPYFIFGPILLILFIFVVIKYPILGLYTYMLFVYLRPQDLLGFLVPLRPNILLLAITVFSYIIHRKMSGKTGITLLGNDKLFLAFLVAAVMSNLTSIWFSSSIETTTELLKISIFYFLAVMMLDNRMRLKRYFMYYLYAVGFVSLIQIYTYLTVGLTRSTGNGGYGIIIGGTTILGGGGALKTSSVGVNGVGGYSSHFYGNASELGIGLCVVYPLSYFLFRSETHRGVRIILLALTAMFIISIALTGSRGAFVGMAISMLLILYKEKRLLMGLLVLAILSGPIIYVASDKYISRIESIAEYETDQSVGIRFQLWRAAADMFADYPVFGVGTGNFAVAYGSTYRAKDAASLYWSPHNIFIQILTEMGLVGFTVYILFLAFIFWINKKSRRILINFDEGKMLYHISQGIDVALVGYVIAGQFVTATYYPHVFQLSIWTSAIYLVALKLAKKPEIPVHDKATV